MMSDAAFVLAPIAAPPKAAAAQSDVASNNANGPSAFGAHVAASLGAQASPPAQRSGKTDQAQTGSSTSHSGAANNAFASQADDSQGAHAKPAGKSQTHGSGKKTADEASSSSKTGTTGSSLAPDGTSASVSTPPSPTPLALSAPKSASSSLDTKKSDTKSDGGDQTGKIQGAALSVPGQPLAAPAVAPEQPTPTTTQDGAASKSNSAAKGAAKAAQPAAHALALEGFTIAAAGAVTAEHAAHRAAAQQSTTQDAKSDAPSSAQPAAADSQTAVKPAAGDLSALINVLAAAGAAPLESANLKAGGQSKPAEAASSSKLAASDKSGAAKAQGPSAAETATDPAVPTPSKSDANFAKALIQSAAQDGTNLKSSASAPGAQAPAAQPTAALAQNSASAIAGLAAATQGTTASQASSGAASIRAQMDGPRASLPAEAIALEINRHQAAGIDHFDIRLDPPELGHISVRIDLSSDGTTKAHLIADRQDTLDLMQRDARSLERALNTVGLKTDRDGLAFSLRQDGSSGQGRWSGGSPGGAGSSGSGSETETAQPSQPQRINIIDPTRIDLLI